MARRGLCIMAIKGSQAPRNRNREQARGAELLRPFEKLGKQTWAEDMVQQQQQEHFFISKAQAYFMLQECTRHQDLDHGRRVQFLMLQSGLDWDSTLADYLIRLFGSCGSHIEANLMFIKVIDPTAYTWSAIITAHAKLGKEMVALQLYCSMLLSGEKSDKYILLSVLKSCSIVSASIHGRLIHSQIVETNFYLDVVMGSTLLDMYAKCGSVEEARKVFESLPNRNIVSWNAMISGYAKCGNLDEACKLLYMAPDRDTISWNSVISGYSQQEEGLVALDCFDKMQREGLSPDKVTFTSILKACGSITDIEQGKHIHNWIMRSGLQSDVFVGSAIVDMYAKCGNLDEAREVFNKLQNRNLVSWTTLISGYAQQNRGILAIECFEDMQSQGIQPDKVTFLGILKACSTIGAVQYGQTIHDHIIKRGFELDNIVGNTLIDMYFKCGKLDDACHVFNKMPNPDIVSWNAMVSGYAQVGDAILAAQYLQKMQENGIMPNDVTYTGILSACCRVGLVDEGRRYFRSIVECYGITHSIFHYNCMVDLLGRGTCFREAEYILLTAMPLDVCGWKTFLSACRTLGNVELAQRCFNKLVHLDPGCTAGYVLMSTVYSNEQMAKVADKLVEYDVPENKSHSCIHEIYAMLDEEEEINMFEKLNRQ